MFEERVKKLSTVEEVEEDDSEIQWSPLPQCENEDDKVSPMAGESERPQGGWPVIYVTEEDGAEVRCKYEECGCSWKGNASDLQWHLKDECEFVKVQCGFRTVGCTVSPLRRDLAKHREECIGEHLQLTFQAFSSMKVEFEEKIREQRAIFDRRLREKEKMIETFQKQISEMSTQISHLFHNMDSHNEELLEQRRASVSSLLSLKSTQEPCPPLEFTMTDFENRKANDLEWESQEFYSHSGGYKLKMKVYANRQLLGDGKHMSVYFYLLRGEYDGLLEWPRKITIAVELFNHNKGDWGSQKVTDNIWENPATYHQGGSGWPQFLSLSELEDSENSRYLKDNAVIFRIASVRLASV